MIDKVQTGKRIAIMRKKLGLSQSALAEKLNVSTQAVSKWECGQALPDVDLLVELSWLFGISINNMLEGGEKFTTSIALNPTKLPEQADRILKSKESKKLMLSMAPYFTEIEITEIARQYAINNLSLDCKITASISNKQKSVEISLPQLSENTLRELAPYLSEVSNIAVGDIPTPLKRINELLVCPECGEMMQLYKNGEDILFSCSNKHIAKVVDGVIYFNTREIQGEYWSLYLRNYEHYYEVVKDSPTNHNYKRGRKLSSDVIWEKLTVRKPKIILDVASGTGSGVGRFIHKIDWQCVIILTDISFRILSWDKIYFETVKANPFVDIVCIACDCARMPIKSDSVDVVLSNCGFESMRDKRLDGFAEAYRILAKNGAAIYNMSVVENKNEWNTKKWLSLTRTLDIYNDKEFAEDYIEISEWLDTCSKQGFLKTETEKIYGELPAPDTDVFPFENEIMQWMCDYVCISEK